VVSSIIAPFGSPIEERSPVPTAEERIAERERKKAEKDERRKRRSTSAEAEAGADGRETSVA
jgi:small subunit ribosomal protein S17